MMYFFVFLIFLFPSFFLIFSLITKSLNDPKKKKISLPAQLPEKNVISQDIDALQTNIDNLQKTLLDSNIFDKSNLPMEDFNFLDHGGATVEELNEDFGDPEILKGLDTVPAAQEYDHFANDFIF